MTTYYLDPRESGGGNNANDGLSFANRKLTLAGFTLAAGDVVRVIQSPNATSLGVSGTWTDIGTSATDCRKVTLSAGVNKTVTNCKNNWTASANVTCTLSGTIRQGSNSQSIAIASGFTTGKAAYFALSGSTDYSGYEQISFWIRPDTSVSANVLRLSLCSDTTGDTQVDNFDIDFALVANRWHPVTLNKGSALGNAIQSVALYCQSDPGTVTVLLDNIFTVKAASSGDSLSLNSLIGKNTGTESWWAIKSISGATDTSDPVTVQLDYNPGTSSNPKGYYGTTETVVTYKRETVKPVITTGSSQTVTGSSGTSGNVITISGGWNDTDMSTQTGETWLDGRTGQGTGWDSNSKDYIDWDKVGAVRFDTGVTISGNNNTGGFVGLGNNSTYGLFNSGTGTYLDDGIKGVVSCPTYGVYLNGGTFYCANLYQSNGIGSNSLNSTSCKIVRIPGAVECNNCGNIGISFSTGTYLVDLGTTTTNRNDNTGLFTSHSGEMRIKSLTTSNNASIGLVCSSNSGPVRIYGYTSTGNGTRSITLSPFGKSDLYIWNASIAEGTKVLISTTYANARVYSQHEGGTFNNNIIYTDDGQITCDYGSVDPHTIGGVDWKIAVTGSTRTSFYPIRFSIAKIAVNSGTLVTVDVWVKKSHSSNISCQVIIPGGQISGVPNDLTSTVTGTSYQKQTLTFTPTQVGVVEMFADVWSDTGSTTEYVRVADVSLSQL